MIEDICASVWVPFPAALPYDIRQLTYAEISSPDDEVFRVDFAFDNEATPCSTEVAPLQKEGRCGIVSGPDSPFLEA
jgi:hypothetical protein